jgi:hypothetical protein
VSDSLVATLVSAFALIVASAVTIYLTKQKEREAAWRDKRLQYYEEFFAAGSGIVGDKALPVAKVRFANAVNNLHLIASNDVLKALHEFCDEIAESNRRREADRHDILWSRLVWEIRNDLKISPTDDASIFRARLWASGTGTNVPDIADAMPKTGERK